MSVPAWESEQGIGLGREPNGDGGAYSKVEHLDFPVVDFIELGEGEIGLNCG